MMKNITVTSHKNGTTAVHWQDVKEAVVAMAEKVWVHADSGGQCKR